MRRGERRVTRKPGDLLPMPDDVAPSEGRFGGGSGGFLLFLAGNFI